MTLQRREKILASIALGLVALAGGWFLFFSGDGRSAAQLAAKCQQLKTEVATKQKELEAAARDAARLAEWKRRALPSDRQLARSLYQNWLRGLANRVHFRQLNIESKELESRRDMFTRMGFTLHGHATLGDLTQFLYEFHSAGHLHQIRQMDVKPLENSRELDVNLTVEALSLPNADRKDRLSAERGKGLKLAKLEDYRDVIVNRDVFAPYVPPKPAKPAVVEKPKKPVDRGQYTFVTGFTEVDGQRQVWIQDRIAGKTWQLAEGAEFKVGDLPGKVCSIGPAHEATIDFDGQCRRLRDGDNLRSGTAIKEP